MRYSSFAGSRAGRGVAAVFAALIVTLALPALAHAQTGQIVGTVTDASSGRPLESVQISVQETGEGALTNQAGRFALLNQPEGDLTLVAILVGYKQVQRTVTVTAGETTTVELRLDQTALELDELVVTGAGVATEKKRLGNSIATIDAASLEDAPIQSFSNLLQGREPGVVGLPSSGTTGEGARIRIRGSASLSQSNEPIVFVDGVRVDNGGGFGAGVSAGGQGAPSRLDDIDPNSIERVEVLKGAAAATLYGTEASNGVIQIFTKRGRQGAPRWTVQIDQTAVSTPTGRMMPLADYAGDHAFQGGLSTEDQIANIRNRFGIDVQPYEVFEVDLLPTAFETGYNQQYSVSVEGGGDLITYFVSGRFTTEDGPFGLEDLGPARDENTKRQATTNINIFPFDNLRVRFSAFYSELDHQTPSNANNIFGAFSSAMMSQPRFATENNLFGQPAFATTRENMHREISQEAENFAGSLNMNYTVGEGLVMDGTIGVNVVNQRSTEFNPFGWNVDGFATSDAEGRRQIVDRNNREVTADFKGSWTTDLNDDFDSQFIVGAQGFLTQTLQSGGQGQNFPGAGLEVVGAGAQQTVLETWLREVNAGVYLQEQIGWRDWAFLTLGGRWDANSAFGENFQTIFYPKASFSAVLSDRAGWESETLSSLQLRGSIGQSGLQPGAFDQFTTFSPLPSAEGPGVQPANLGNQNLKPEISTEWELGAEMGFFNDRFGLDFTYWDRTVSDALVARQFPVSGGFTATQLDNIGELTGNGFELSINGSIVQGENFSLNAFANTAYLNQEVTDLGGAPPLKTGGSYVRYRNFLIEGYAPGAFFGAKVADVPIPLDLNGDCSVPTRAQAEAYFADPANHNLDFEVIPERCGADFLNTYLGKPDPDFSGSFGFNASIGSSITVNTLFEYKAGDFWVQDLSGMFRQAHPTIGRNTPDAARVASVMYNPAASASDKVDAAVEWAQNLRALAPMAGMNGVHRADFVRFRELSISYRLPSGILDQFGFDTGSISLAGRNLFLWMNDDYTGMDPETNAIGRCDGTSIDCQFLNSVEGWGIPIPRRYTISLRFGF